MRDGEPTHPPVRSWPAARRDTYCRPGRVRRTTLRTATLFEFAERLSPSTGGLFDKVRQVDEAGREVWPARELMEPLGYKKWQYFRLVIDDATEACRASGFRVEEHYYCPFA